MEQVTGDQGGNGAGIVEGFDSQLGANVTCPLEQRDTEKVGDDMISQIESLKDLEVGKLVPLSDVLQSIKHAI